MPELDDHELLADYVRHESQEAFATLVRRYVNLVYSTALRFTGNAHHAEEITQAVFVILARKATKLSPRTVMSGWLYQTARLTAANFVKSEMRRQRREQEAYVQSTLNESDAAAWEQIAPVLDEAMGRLGETDRNAVVLRFFENKTAAEVAVALKTTEAAIHKRVSRALEKLRKIFTKRGLMLSATTIGAIVSANSVQAAPIGLATTIAATAAKGSVVAASTLTLVKGALEVMAWTKAKTAIVAGVAVLLATGTTTVIVKTVETLSEPEIQGTWQGTLMLSGSGVERGERPKTRLVLEIAKRNGRYEAIGANIDQGMKDVHIQNFTYHHHAIHGEIPDSIISFDGTVSKDGKKLSGTWKEGKDSEPLEFARTTNPPEFPEALADADFVPRAGSALQGHWKGAIQVGKNPLAITVKITEPTDGTFHADFYCPPQGGNRQPTMVSYDGETVRIITMAGYGMFEGRLSNGNKELIGDWIQGGNHMTTVLTRAN